MPPSRFTIHEILKKFETTGSLANKKQNRKCTFLTEETLDEIGASLERTPTKSMPKLAEQVEISESSAHRATKLLKVKPFKCTSVQSLKQDDPVSRMHYCEWFHSSVNDGLIDPQLLFFSDEAWFHLNGRVNTLNCRYWASENPHRIQEIPHYDRKVGVWCAVSARCIIGPIFYKQTVNTERYQNYILTPFFHELTEEEKSYRWFQQDSATAHTAEESMNKIREVFEDRVISAGVWPSRSPDLTVCDFYLWGNLKGKVY